LILVLLPFGSSVSQLLFSLLSTLLRGSLLSLLKVLYFLAPAKRFSICLHGKVARSDSAVYVLLLGLELVIEDNLIGFGLDLVMVKGLAELFIGDLGSFDMSKRSLF
jgi:hypothetical protein